MADDPALLTLHIAGKDYRGWTGVPSIRTGMDALAGGFSVDLAEKFQGVVELPVQIEDDVLVQIGGQTIIHGQVDDVVRELAPDDHRVNIVGRDATADLVDCAAMNSPGEWRNADGLAIIRAIAKPFGISVELAGTVSLGGAFDTFTLQKGEKAAAAISRICAARGALPYSDGRGVLVIGPGKPTRISTKLVEGQNLKKVSHTASRRGRYRDYTVHAQSGLWGDSGANAGTTGTAHDSGIRRYRPTARLADDLADGVTAADQAAWDAMIGKAKGNPVSCTVAGWLHADGPWRPNQEVYVEASTVGFKGWRLIASVEMTLDKEGGTVAVLSTLGAGAFDVLAEKQKGGTVAW